MNKKYILESKFLISSNYLFNVITDSCSEHITVGLNIYLFGCVSLLAPECAECGCLWVFVCVISNESTSKKPHYLSDLSKPVTLLLKTHIKILGLDLCRSIILSKIAHQIWGDDPFSKRNKKAKNALGVQPGDERE